MILRNSLIVVYVHMYKKHAQSFVSIFSFAFMNTLYYIWKGFQLDIHASSLLKKIITLIIVFQFLKALYSE